MTRDSGNQAGALLLQRPRPQSGRDGYLDGLRVLATLLIILLHCIAPFLSDGAIFGTRAWWLCNVVNGATRTGVPLFFMMSGHLALSAEGTLDIGSFYKKRFSRTLPPFLVWNAVYFLYHAALAARSGEAVVWSRFFRELLVSGSSYHLWFVYTLSGLYLLAPFIKKMTDACTTRQLVLLLVLVSFTGTIRPLLNTVLPVYIFLFDPLMEGYFAYFLLGYLLCTRTLPRAARGALYAAGLGTAALNIALSYLMSSTQQVNLPLNGIYGIAQMVCAAAILVFFKHHGPGASRRLTALSGITYGVYLCHALMLHLAERFLVLPSVGLRILLAFAAVTAVSFALMWALSKVRYLNRLLL